MIPVKDVGRARTPRRHGICRRCLEEKDLLPEDYWHGYGVCADCKARQLPPVEHEPQVSVRATSAGLPGLGKRR